VNELTPTIDCRPPSSTAVLARTDEETLVADTRASLTPSQHVEQRLIGMLKTTPVMISQMQRRLKPGPR
jgi:hypothetical protein